MFFLSSFPSPLGGEGGARSAPGEGSACQEIEFCKQVFQDRRAPLQHIIVPVADDPKSFSCQDGVPLLVMQIFDVLAAINFDQDPAFEAHEIQYEVLKWHLPPKLEAREATVAKQMPHDGFGVGRLSTHASCIATTALGNRAMMSDARHDPSPGPAFGRATLSHKGRG